MKPTSDFDWQATEPLTMKAVINARYGSPDVLEIRQVPKPDPRAGQVLIRVHATTVSRTDCGMLRPHPFFVRLVAGLRRPRRTILGMDFAGVVEAVGAGVVSFKPGDRVFGLSPDDYGAHAEYLCVPETGAIATMPAGAGFGEVDYTAQDFTKIGETFDFVFDAVGKTTFSHCRSLLKLEGVFAATDLGPWCQNPLLTVWSSINGSHRVIFPLPQSNKARAFVDFLKARMEAGEFRAVIDRAYRLESIADAYRYVETGQKTGIVVVNVGPADRTAHA